MSRPPPEQIEHAIVVIARRFTRLGVSSETAQFLAHAAVHEMCVAFSKGNVYFPRAELVGDPGQKPDSITDLTAF
jgi:hypothetical protein